MPAARSCGSVVEEAADGGHHVVVVRIGVGHARRQTDVGGDDGGTGGGAHVQVGGVGEPADVVAHVGAGGEARLRHARAPGVDAERQVEPSGQRFDRGHDPVQLFGLGHLVAGSCLDATDVEEVRTVDDELFGLGQEGVERPVAALVVERVGRAVQDAHHDSSVTDVEGPRPELEGRGGLDDPDGRHRRLHRRDATRSARPIRPDHVR